MSDSDIGKRMVEEEQAELFLEEYNRISGDSLKIINKLERPDFICVRASGEGVGLEATWVPTNPDDVIHDLYASVVKKEQRRTAPADWTLRNATILVLIVTDASIENIVGYAPSIVRSDFASTGFIEVWAADYGSVGIYGFVDLFGLSPDQWWGHHRKEYPKPYG